ncbi:MAG: glycosyltransferase [Candidatus Omnitrophota bacterium]
MNEKINIIIPIFKKKNEIYTAVDDAVTAVRQLTSNFKIILLIEDDTSSLALNYIGKFDIEKEKIYVVKRNPNIASSQSLLDGIAYVSEGLVLYIDPDMNLVPGQIKKLFDYFYENHADIAVASKVHSASKVKYSLPRKAGSFLYSSLIKALFRVAAADTRPELKLFKYEALKAITLLMVTKEYAFDLEILVLARKLGYKVVSAPVMVEFKANLRQIGFLPLYFALVDTLAVFYRLKVIKFYDRLVRKMPEKFPFVSIIIPIAKPNELLEKNLRACLELDYPDYEIIVLPDEEGFIFPSEKVKIIPTGKVFPSEKRDLAIKQAKGEIIAFLDDDAIPVRDWLINAVKCFDKEEVAAVGGPAVTPDNNTLMQKAGGAVYASLLVAGFKNCRYIPQMPQEVDDHPSCNLFIRKDVLEKIGGFQTDYWPGEDTILCLKIVKDLNKKIVYSPDVLVYHHRRPLFLPHLRQIERYALHRGYFVKKFPETSLRLSYFMPSLLLLWLVFGAVLSLMSGVFAIIYVCANLVYLILVALTSMATTNPKLTLPVFFGIIFTHITYGFWFIKGLICLSLKEDKREKNQASAV